MNKVDLPVVEKVEWFVKASSEIIAGGWLPCSSEAAARTTAKKIDSDQISVRVTRHYDSIVFVKKD